MYNTVKSSLQGELKDIKDAGLYKEERIITSPQAADIQTKPQSGLIIYLPTLGVGKGGGGFARAEGG